MRITNAHLAGILPGAASEVAAPEETPRRENLSPSAQEDAIHTPSAELSYWLALVRQQPEVRTDEVARVAKRLASGFYGTAACAQETAEAILNASE